MKIRRVFFVFVAAIGLDAATVSRGQDSCPFSDKTVCRAPTDTRNVVLNFCDSLIDLVERDPADLFLTDGTSAANGRFRSGQLQSRLDMGNGASLRCYADIIPRQYYGGYCTQKFDGSDEYEQSYKLYLKDLRACAKTNGYEEFRTSAGAAPGQIGLRGTYGFSKGSRDMYVYARTQKGSKIIGFQWKIMDLE